MNTTDRARECYIAMWDAMWDDDTTNGDDADDDSAIAIIAAAIADAEREARSAALAEAAAVCDARANKTGDSFKREAYVSAARAIRALAGTPAADEAEMAVRQGYTP